jgi:hypothetical protein
MSWTKFVSYPQRPERLWAGPSSYPIYVNTGGFLRRLTRPGREVDHAPPPNEEVKNSMSLISAPSSSLYDV